MNAFVESVNQARPTPLWWSQTDLPRQTRESLAADLKVDVAIVGAGFSGLWAAYYLKLADPTLSVAVLEAGCVGFGASGRNGGWASALFPAAWQTVAERSNPEAARRLLLQMHESIDVLGSFIQEHSLEVDWHKGGTVVAARNQLQLDRAKEHVAYENAWGDLGVRLLSEDETRTHLAARGTIGGSYTPHCAVVHPAKLVIGLSQVVEQLGVKIFEKSKVDSVSRNMSVGTHRISAGVVLRATEAFTALLPETHREIVPIYSLMIATEPLSERVWQQIGLQNRETFADYGLLVIYGQRTSDGRLAFGGRGAPYHFGSAIETSFDQSEGVHKMLAQTLVQMFPVLADYQVEYKWGGPVGVPRDWYAGVRYDHETGIGSVGGYVGDGVTTSNLAGRTFTDLVLGRESELTKLPWVNQRVKLWEPEPLRWLAINSAITSVRAADWLAESLGMAAPWSFITDRLTGRSRAEAVGHTQGPTSDAKRVSQ